MAVRGEAGAHARDVLTIICFMSIAWEPIPCGGGEIGGDTAAVLPGLKLGTVLFSLKPSVDVAHTWDPSSNPPGWLEQK